MDRAFSPFDFALPSYPGLAARLVWDAPSALKMHCRLVAIRRGGFTGEEEATSYFSVSVLVLVWPA